MSKLFKRYSTHILFASIKREVYYPTYTMKGYLFRYLSAFVFTLFFFLISIAFKLKSMTVLLLVLAIIVTSWISGLGAAFFSAIFGSLLLYFLFFYPVVPDITYFIEIIIMIIIATTSGLSIYYSKKINQLTRFHHKEKALLKSITMLKKQNAELQAEIIARDEFLSIASHELKTPLTTTLLKLQIALNNIRNTSLANFSVQNLMDMLLSAEQQAQRLAKMIGDLLNVSLMRTGRMELELEKCDLNTLTNNVINGLTEKAKKEKIEIKFQQKDTVLGKFDKMRIEQVLINLINNAMKYGNKKPIEIKVKKTNKIGIVTIKDYGIGIPTKQKTKIFDLFERGVKNGQKNGLGVGLFISNQIVKAHKGRLSLKSTEKKGTTFYVELPL